VEIRAFHRRDRDQLTELVNAHIGAVVPGWAVSVSVLLAQLEREPAQYVVDPWVVERTALVALERHRVVAGAYVKRYASDSRVSPDYDGAGEIAWLVCLPTKLHARAALAVACVQQLEDWNVTRQWADGSLPTPATFGVSDAWPHVSTPVARRRIRRRSRPHRDPAHRVTGRCRRIGTGTDRRPRCS
jgi:hypothetical protein